MTSKRFPAAATDNFNRRTSFDCMAHQLATVVPYWWRAAKSRPLAGANSLRKRSFPLAGKSVVACESEESDQDYEI